ncbi:MAG TPA: hypothetical protein DCG57_10960 [Candidatus Riflebacteria bacterium]|nr:hypothetical protein [Candidatus Riflebacteria bacterium]
MLLRCYPVLVLMTFALALNPVLAGSMRAEPSHQNVYNGLITNVYPDLANGMYLVHAKISNPDNVRNLPAGYRLAVYSFEHLTTRDGEERGAEYIIIKNTPDVKFSLSGDPEIFSTNDKYEFALHISMNEEAAQQLQKFTAANIMRSVALVAGGKILTMHKIRSEITGGKLQITRCNDNGCQYIYNSLRTTSWPTSTLR